MKNALLRNVKLNYVLFLVALLMISNAAFAQVPILQQKDLLSNHPHNDARTRYIPNNKNISKNPSTTNNNSATYFYYCVFERHQDQKTPIDTLNARIYGPGLVNALQNFSIQNDANQNSYVHTEIASTFFRNMRVALGGNFKSTGDTAKDKEVKASIQNIITSGGAATLTLSYPFLYYKNSRGNPFGATILLMDIIGATPGPGTATFTNTSMFTNTSGLYSAFYMFSNDKKSNFSLELPFYYYNGNQEAYKQLSVHSDFWLLQLKAGITFNDKITVKVSLPVWSSSKNVQSTPFSLTFQTSPSQIFKSK